LVKCDIVKLLSLLGLDCQIQAEQAVTTRPKVKEINPVNPVNPVKKIECSVGELSSVAAGELALGQDVTLHRLQELFVGRAGGEVELGVEGVELEDVAVG
jgi:hypothetical protein